MGGGSGPIRAVLGNSRRFGRRLSRHGQKAVQRELMLFLGSGGRIRFDVGLGPFGLFGLFGLFVILFIYLMAGLIMATVVAAILAAVLGVILFAVVALASDRLLVAMSPVWRARRAARGPLRRPLMAVAMVVGALGPRGEFQHRTMTTGVKVAAAVGKVIPSGPSTPFR
jgi:hypothetical protein